MILRQVQEAGLTATTRVPTQEQAWAAAAAVPDPEVPVLTIEDLGVLRSVDGMAAIPDVARAIDQVLRAASVKASQDGSRRAKKSPPAKPPRIKARQARGGEAAKTSAARPVRATAGNKNASGRRLAAGAKAKPVRKAPKIKTKSPASGTRMAAGWGASARKRNRQQRLTKRQ